MCDKEEFYMKILDEKICCPTGFSGIEEECYQVQCFEGQGYKTDVIWLRKSLIRTLYVIVDVPKKFILNKPIQLELKLF